MTRPFIEPVGHSPLGGSSMDRAIKCPGSVPLSFGIEDDHDDTFSGPGTAAHHLSEQLLKPMVTPEAWRWIGVPIKVGDMQDAVTVDKEMADALQLYVEFINDNFPDRNQGNSGVETFIHCPTIHQYFWMATDFWYLDELKRRLTVADFKYGAGIVVEAEGNVQLRYYACGVMEKFDLWDKVDSITLWIAQPRGWHFDGPFREWTITTEELQAWLEDELIPAMDKALVSRDTTPGEHCRFCPVAGRQCPSMLALTEEMMKMIDEFQLSTEGQAKPLTVEQISRFAVMEDALKVASKHVGKASFGALQAGQSITNRKLVAKQTHREWRDEKAEKALVKQFGDEAYEDRKLKSPAQIEGLPGGVEFVTKHAFKPDGGLTVGTTKDSRKAVNKDLKSGFVPVKKRGK